MTGSPAAEVRITAYAVSILPESHPEVRNFTIRILSRGGQDRWVLEHAASFLAETGQWDAYSPADAAVFTSERAIELAREHAPHIGMGDGQVWLSAADVYRRTAR
jgi:hypothetical protein